jgi:fumarylacetoacetate (FAA) hydrolase
MKFVSYLNGEQQERLGFLIDNEIVDLKNEATKYNIELPSKMDCFLSESEKHLDLAREVLLMVQSNGFDKVEVLKKLAPVPRPTSCRDGYAFRQHVAAARRNRGVDMIAEFDQYPIFYFTNHNAVYGEGELTLEQDHFNKLDFELEWAAVIGKKGKNVSSDKADDYIFGYTIMNDWSARTLQMEEMLLNLGPAKGKDFATTIGPYLITKDELEEYRVTTEFGNKYNLEMKAFHNGKQVSQGNTIDMNWTFAEIVERCAYGTDIYPGDVIGSGTVGTGCYLELNGTWAREAKEQGTEFTPIWIQPGDTFELEITALGKLVNEVKLSGDSYSLLSKKKLG